MDTPDDVEAEYQATMAEAQKTLTMVHLIQLLRQAIERYGYDTVLTQVAYVVFADELDRFGEGDPDS